MTLFLESINLCGFDSAGPMKISGDGRDWCYFSYRHDDPVPIQDIDLLVWIVGSSPKKGDDDKKFIEECGRAWLEEFAEVKG